DSPATRPVSRYGWGTSRTPYAVLIRIGHTLAKTTRMSVIFRPSPAARMATGMSATDGTGRRKRTRILPVAAAHHHVPIAAPSTRPRPAAIARPSDQAVNVVASGRRSVPLSRSRPAAMTIEPNEGTNGPGNTPTARSNSHTPTAAATPTAPLPARRPGSDHGRRRTAAAVAPDAAAGDVVAGRMAQLPSSVPGVGSRLIPDKRNGWL